MADETRTGLPASIEAAWGLRERPRRGPKRGLSLERIVDAAVKVAVTDGLDAVSMSRVAAELGSSPMSLYRYVAAKDELLALMIDRAGEPPSDLVVPGEGWRAGLTRWSWAYRELLLRHPWILRIPISGPPVTPNQIAWLEQGLRAMHDTGLAEGDKLSVMLLLSGFVRNESLLTIDLQAAARAAGVEGRDAMPTYGRLLATLTDAERFPALHRVIDAGVFDEPDDPDAEFVFGLERILDGVEALMRRRG